MVNKRIDEVTSGTADPADLLLFWDASAAATRQDDLQSVVARGSHYYSTSTHSSAAVLSVTRAGRAQRIDVTVSANITGWTDNLVDGDVLNVFLLGDGGSTDYTAALSSLLVENGGNVGTLNIYPTTEIELVVAKRGANLWTTVKVWNTGSTATSFAYRGAATQKDLTAVTTPSGTVTGDTTIIIATAGGASDSPYPSGGTWGTTPALTGATKIGEQLGLSFQPSVAVWEGDYDGDASYTAGYNFDSQCAVITFDGTATTVTYTQGRGQDGTPVSPIDWGSGVSRAAGDFILAFCVNQNGTEPPSGDPTDWTRIVAHLGDFHGLVVWRYDGSSTGTLTPSSTGFTGSGTEQHVTGFITVTP